MLTLPILPVIGFVGILAFAGVMLFTRRRKRCDIECPVEGGPRHVVFTGRSIDPDHWYDVRSCGRPGEEPLEGGDIVCTKRCLDDPANRP